LIPGQGGPTFSSSEAQKAATDENYAGSQNMNDQELAKAIFRYCAPNGGRL
jgi:hypothetical protein